MKINEWITFRKQNDMVKLAMIFLVLGMGFFLRTILLGIGFADDRNERTEYILSKSGKIEERDLTAVLELENVGSASRETEESVKIKWKGKQTEVTCVLVTKDYIENLYGISCEGNTKTFYINEAAFELINQELSISNGGSWKEEDMTGKGMTFAISVMQESETAEKYKKAQLTVQKDQVHGEEPFFCTYDSEIALFHKATGIRVILDKKSLDGTDRTKLEKLGFSIQNEEELIAWEYEMRIWMMRMEYGILIAVLCFTSGIAILKREVRSS